MGVLFVVFAMAMAFATFYENDFGATAARSMVYNTWWFEWIMILMVINLIGQIFNYKLYKRKKLTILLFHLAFVLIIIGAGITRYFGFEGVVHIREGAVQNLCTTYDKYINFDIKDKDGNILFSDSKKALIISNKKVRYSKSASVNNVDYKLKLDKLIPNATQSLVDDINGKPMISLVISGRMMAQQSFFLEEGDVKNIGGLNFGFNSKDSVDININLEEDLFKLQSVYAVSYMSMTAQGSGEYESGAVIPFEEKKIYKVNGLSIVPEKLSKSAKFKPVSVENNGQQVMNRSALVFDLNYNNKATQIYLWLGQNTDNMSSFMHEDQVIEVSYKAKQIRLPFSLKLNDFILDRYPGSNSPSSYKSNVTLIDTENNITMPYSIYMNHILKYKGWRFYQSSYDRDERGTILSVNKDFAGMFVTYLGYFTLFLFIILSLLNKNSLFRKATPNLFKSTSGKAGLLIVLFLLGAGVNSIQAQRLSISKKQANKFGKVLVQDQRGRTEPLYTLSNDILRKVARKTEIKGHNSMQVFLGLYFDFGNWSKTPLIKISSSEVRKVLGISGDYAAFADIVNLNTNEYKLNNYVNLAYEKPANARNKFDKEIIKVDERVNIIYMIYIGEFMKIFPVNDPNMKWHAPKDAFNFARNSEDSVYLKNIINLYSENIWNGNDKGADEIVQSIMDYQRKFAQYELPSSGKIKAEIFYYRSNIYDKLFPFYTTIGFILLIVLIFGIITQRKEQKIITRIFTGLFVIGFLFHTLGLAIRWYVSGHAPMSNGFESLVFISWVTVLIGFIFGKRSAFILAATSVLAGFTLLVAHLSFMDPEITNLVPVLKSYWLTLHVSVIISSYGFFGLGAILGIIVLVLYSVSNRQNKDNIANTIEELTVISYKGLTVGLYLLTIGTFLGAIWANESWGRYWGWDPKETWSLISIIVYSFIIHARMIQGLKGFYAFNVMSLFGFSAILMTYFGVNYYLSGLHSYAGGDPVPVPNFVYVSVVLLISLSLFAYWKKKTVVKEH